MNIKVLDCTLRDGGYVNNWKFSHRQICKITKSTILITGADGFIGSHLTEMLVVKS
jgi:hypothetical protein